MGIVCTLLSVYSIAIIARIVLDYIRVPSDHPVGRIRNLLAAVIDPALLPLRRVLPAIPAGHMRIDLSPIVLIIGVSIVQDILC